MTAVERAASPIPQPPAPAPGPAPHLPLRTRLAILLRMFAIQGSWNYESLLGNGVGFCVEPALRLLPGGIHTPRFKEALGRESRYFNAHPYLAAVAVGALARAELDGVPADRIERFRKALSGPLGSVGDRLVWAGWLPLCSILALVAFGLGAGALATVGLFLAVYNAGHVALRIWGFQVGWSHGLRVASALGTPLLQRGPTWLAQAVALAAGLALPLAFVRVIGPGKVLLGGTLGAVAVGAVVVARLEGRLEGWRLALLLLGTLALFSVAR